MLGYDYLKLNTLVRFMPKAERLRIYANAGVSNGLVLEESVRTLMREVRLLDSHFTSELDISPKARKFEQAVVVGVGAGVGRFEVEVRYERGNGMDPFVNSKSRTQRIHLLTAFRL